MQEHGSLMSRGTRVFDDSGNEITGVTEIVITAKLNDLVRVQFRRNVQAGELDQIAVPDRQVSVETVCPYCKRPTDSPE